MKHTNYQFKLEETNSFGKEYCDDPNILRKFCNTKRPNEMWTEALSKKPKRKIYFENGKDLEECNLNQTLRQCDERAGILDSEFAIRLMNTLTSLLASMNRKYPVLKSLPPKTQHGTHHFPE